MKSKKILLSEQLVNKANEKNSNTYNSTSAGTDNDIGSNLGRLFQSDPIRLYQSILDQLNESIFVLDSAYCYQYANQRFLLTHDVRLQQIIGQHVQDVIGEAFFRDPIQVCLQRCFQGESQQIVHTFGEQTDQYLDITMTPLLMAEQSIEAVMLTMRDITKAKQHTDRLSFQASHDALTGLVNRREFEQRLQQALQATRDQHYESVLCYIDLDQFKLVNDSVGHLAGDRMLKELADLLRNNIRREDVLARLGGDEFALLLHNCPLEQAVLITQGLIKHINQFRFHWQDQVFAIGASIGLVPITDTEQDLNQLLAQADMACYAAKRGGRNRVHVYNSVTSNK